LMVQNQVQSKVTAPIDKTATLFLSWSGNIFSSL
jgi:hypothetical protein